MTCFSIGISSLVGFWKGCDISCIALTDMRTNAYQSNDDDDDDDDES